MKERLRPPKNSRKQLPRSVGGSFIVLTFGGEHNILLCMISELRLTNFTRFSKVRLNFSEGLNVFVGTNGTGKSHIMKLMYANLQAMRKEKDGSEAPTMVHIGTKVAQRLVGVFKPDALGRLARRCQGHTRTQVAMCVRGESHKDQELSYTFSTRSQITVNAERIPQTWVDCQSVFLPTREMLSIYPNFISTYDRVEIPFDETWRDLAKALGNPLPKGPHRESVNALAQPLEDALCGKIVLDQGRFYISSKNGRVEAHLLAEGMRKIGTLAQLIVNGTLSKGSVLFWDEPEANLNPQLIKLVAQTIIGLVRQGLQVFIATHSLFLLRQLYLLAPQEHREQRYRYFALGRATDVLSEVPISTSFSLAGLGEVASLDYQLEQDEQLMRLYSNGI